MRRLVLCHRVQMAAALRLAKEELLHVHDQQGGTGMGGQRQSQPGLLGQNNHFPLDALSVFMPLTASSKAAWRKRIDAEMSSG